MSGVRRRHAAPTDDGSTTTAEAGRVAGGAGGALSGATDTPQLPPLPHKPLSAGDRWFLSCFALFAVTSFAFEPFVVFGCGGDGGLGVCAALFEDGAWWALPGWLFDWYARMFDPVFLYTPSWLAVMCGLDFALFGPCYIVMAYGFLKRRPWVRLLGIVYASAITYSCVVYFTFEVIYEAHRADMLWVFIINLPYAIMPILLAARLLHDPVFESLDLPVELEDSEDADSS